MFIELLHFSAFCIVYAPFWYHLNSYTLIKAFFLIGGFPKDFSILVTLKIDVNTNGKVFAVYDEPDATEILSLQVGEITQLIYTDPNGRPPEPVQLAINLNDGMYESLFLNDILLALVN